MPDEIPTPGQVATNEAAKQAVMLVFGLITAVIVMKLQSRMVQQMSESMRSGMDPDAARTRRMEEAKRAERWWGKAATLVFRVSELAWKQADKARASYERDRA